MSTRIVWVAVAAVALLTGGGGALIWRSAGPTRAPAAVPAGSEPIAAQPAPAHRPAPVVAPGACGTAMQVIRRTQRTFPSGAMLTDAANAQLTADLARLDRACATSP